MLPKNMGGLMKQAQKMQQDMMRLQQELAERQFSAQAGGGMVEATVTGKGELVKLRLEREVVDPEDLEMLCDLVVAAVGEAQRRAQATVQEEMQKLTGGLNLPGLM